jgi:hypothetical protein
MGIVTDPWGSQQPPAITGAVPPLPPPLVRLAEVQATGVPLTEEDPYAQDFPAAQELSEVQQLMGQGWRPLDCAPLYCLLPAAWPSEHRAWVPDRRPRVGMGATTDTYWGAIVPLPDDDYDPDEHIVENARRAGLPDPPAGRIWLLRSPWPQIPITVIHKIVWSIVERTPGEDEIAQIYHAARDVLTWTEPRVLAACPPETRELLDAWAETGRTGEAAGEVIEQRLLPAAVTDAISRTGLVEQTLLDWLASLQTELDDDAIGFINAWRATGLPGNPPPGAERFIDRDSAELLAWLDAGFHLYAAAQLELAGLDTARRWREAGFTEADTYELLRADPALTPDEARAFDATGPASERRREWIYYGFSPAEASAWTAAGISPASARLWRACGNRPADVQPGQRIPPQLTEGRRYIAGTRNADGDLMNSDWEEIPDPPGTHGRRARRWAGDDDPWINTD